MRKRTLHLVSACTGESLRSQVLSLGHEFLLAWFFETDMKPLHLSHGPHATASKHLPGCVNFPSPLALSLPCWIDAVPMKPSLPRRLGG